MSTTFAEHPTDENLVAFALDGCEAEVEKHIRGCPSCARYVREVRMVHDDILNVPDTDVPDEIERRIRAHKPPVRHPQDSASSRPGDWYRNPFLIGLGVILAALFFYFFYSMFL